jgi:hypothetical protein
LVGIGWVDCDDTETDPANGVGQAADEENIDTEAGGQRAQGASECEIGGEASHVDGGEERLARAPETGAVVNDQSGEIEKTGASLAKQSEDGCHVGVGRGEGVWVTVIDLKAGSSKHGIANEAAVEKAEYRKVCAQTVDDLVG